MEKESLALGILKEVKANCKRWFIIAIVELVLLVGSNIGWLIFESQYETTTTDEQVMEDIDNSTNSNYTQTIK